MLFDALPGLKNHSALSGAVEISPKEMDPRQRQYAELFEKVYAFHAEVSGHDYSLVMGLYEDFPAKLPEIFLRYPANAELHDHVSYLGQVCFTADRAGVLVDEARPDNIVRKSVEMAIEVLENNLAGDHEELVDEFEGYWQFLPNLLNAHCLFRPLKRIEKIKCLCKVVKGRPIPLIFCRTKPDKYKLPTRITQGTVPLTAFAVHLPTPPFPPDMKSSGVDIRYVRNLLDSLPSDMLKHFHRFFPACSRQRRPKHFFLLFSFDNPRDGRLRVFAVHVHGEPGPPFYTAHPNENWTVEPIRVSRHFREHLVDRGGASSDLNDLAGAVVGCGSVGSRVVELLLHAGIGNLSIVDHETLSPDNTFRHVLGGGPDIGEFKVNALKEFPDYQLQSAIFISNKNCYLCGNQGEKMPRNPVQFQKGLSEFDFRDRYGTEEQCREALFNWRWPDGFVCPRCGGQKYSVITSRNFYQCSTCRKQTSLISGTIFQSTKLSLVVWFAAMYHLTQTKQGISSLELARRLGISQNTAWKVKHKLMQVMLECDSKKKIGGRIEIDDAYIGGESTGKRGRGSTGKTPFIAAVQTTDEGNPDQIKLSVVDGFKKKEVEKWCVSLVLPKSVVVSDGLSCFLGVKDAKCIHERHFTGSGKKAVKHSSFKWVNTALGNIKSSITGSYRSIEGKHTPRYLAEFQYRFNRRYDLGGMIPRLAKVALITPPMPYRLLKLAEIRW